MEDNNTQETQVTQNNNETQENTSEKRARNTPSKYWKKWTKAKHPLPAGTRVKNKEGEVGQVLTSTQGDDGSVMYNIDFPSGNAGGNDEYKYQ